MSPKLLAFFTLFLVFACANALTGVNSTKDNSERYGSQQFYFKYIFYSGSVLILAIIRHITETYEVPVPYAVFCLLIGVLWGIGSQYVPEMLTFAAQSDVVQDNLPHVYLPTIIFTIAFCVDEHTFFKSLTQILLISIPVSLSSVALTGMFMRQVIAPEWNISETLLFSIMSMAIYPFRVFRWLKESSVQTKYVTILLQGETLVSVALSYFLYQLLTDYITGNVIYWYQFLMLTVRAVVWSIPSGYLFGTLGVFFMKITHNDPGLLMLLSLSICYVSFFVTQWMCCAGPLGTMIAGIMMSSQRTSLSKDMDMIIMDTWTLLSNVLDAVIFIYVGYIAPLVVAIDTDIHPKHIIVVLVTYMTANITRFLGFFCFSPILSRTGYGMLFQNMVICVWSGLKSPLGLLLVMKIPEEIDDFTQRLYYLHTFGLFFVMLLINGTFTGVVLRTIGLWEISLTRQTTMNNCMKLIYEVRARTMAILKMDRFLSDANWPLVTSSTLLKHPYKKSSNEDRGTENEEEDFIMVNRVTYCPDCKKHILDEPTRKEMKEMTKEAKLRILKFKKTAYSRQYENGMISRDGVRILHQAVEIALDSKEAVIELDGLFTLFAKESTFYKFLQENLQRIFKSKEESYKEPRIKWMWWCSYIVNHYIFFININAIVLLDITFDVLYAIFEVTEVLTKHLYAAIDIFFLTTYSTEFFMKVFAYTWRGVCFQGLKTYFRFPWNWVEFLILWTTVIEVVFDEVDLDPNLFTVANYMQIVLLTLRLFRVVIRLNLLQFLRPVPTALLKYLGTKANKHRFVAFELGKNYVAGEEEILENLCQIVDNDQIRRDMKEHTENDRHAVCKRLGIAQKERPWVASTVKTKASMRMVLNSMKDDIEELKVSGWVDDVEYNRLLISLSERYKYINTIKLVEPPTPKQIFREVPYMHDDDELIQFLYENVSTKKFDPGDVVFELDEPVDGIYILITGMLVIQYQPNDKVLTRLRETGALPVLDHFWSMTYDEPMYEYFIPGNTVGELSTLTGRSYDGTITAETHSEVFVLKMDVVRKAINMDSDPINGFENRIWKMVAFRIAVNVMMSVPSYRSYTQQHIRYFLERSFVPNLSNYKVFVVSDMMQDIILIEGIVVDYNTRDIYTAPCYIPRAVQKLILPKSSAINIEVLVEIKLLIIPAKDFNEYEIMLNGEQECELVTQDPTKRMRHLILEKLTGSQSVKLKSSHLAKQIRKKIRTESVGSIGRSKITFLPSSSLRGTST